MRSVGEIGYDRLYPGASSGNLTSFDTKACRQRNVAKRRPAVVAPHGSHSLVNVINLQPPRCESVVRVVDGPPPHGAPLWEQHPDRGSSSKKALEHLNFDGTAERNRNTRKNDYPLCVGEIFLKVVEFNGVNLADVSQFTMTAAREQHFRLLTKAMRVKHVAARTARVVRATQAKSAFTLYSESRAADVGVTAEASYLQLSEEDLARWQRKAAAEKLRVEFESEFRQLREGSGGDDIGSGEEDDDE